MRAVREELTHSGDHTLQFGILTFSEEQLGTCRFEVLQGVKIYIVLF
jgi:hypothetical protein